MSPPGEVQGHRACWLVRKAPVGFREGGGRVGSGSRPGERQVALKDGLLSATLSFSSALSPAPLNLRGATFSSLPAASSLSFISLLVCLSSSLDSLFQGGGE